MKKMCIMKRALATGLLTIMVTAFFGCSSSQGTQPQTTNQGAQTPDGGSTGPKQNLVVIIANPNSETSKKVEAMAVERFSDKYNVITKPFDDISIAQTVKTAVAANEQLDLVQYWPNSMSIFTSADLATPLNDYMDDEWKSVFNEGALDIGTYDGTLYNVPYNTVYPLVIVNTDITDAAGITLPDSWTWDEFVSIATEVNQKSDAKAAGINSAWSNWFVRNGLMQIWDTNEEVDRFNAGEVSFKDPKVVEVMEKVKSVFDQGLFYPGEGALAVTLDQANAAFSQGKFAFMFCVNTLAGSILEETGIEQYKIMDWPYMGSNPRKPLLGGCDGYFVPVSVKNVEGAIDMMKFLTSKEVLTLRANDGQVPPAAIKPEGISEEFVESISRSASSIYPTEILNLSAQINTYINNEMPASYVYNGERALDDLESYRKAALENSN